ncbi:centrosomal protein of 295 kDa-like [Limulus polyphemus]|uniref:Centrosomal protein of 295 kDa-like n=1 Tax=Limulus polyphemus TaxID=6850 RepID=A0ABM1TBW7_LIMPO|nr:centrosomal protein of 295 kDa-like [Limulus polyphemus]XP_022253373.1 centrosomal protein of 295 kDa-like [Limulus polyphemus]
MFRLSPAEVNELCFQENLKQRKLRLLQVREQAKNFSADIREDCRKERGKQINALKRKITKELKQEKENDLRLLESIYEGQLKKFGEGHRAAQNQPDIEQLKEEKMKNQEAVATSRGKEALAALRKEAALKNTEAKKQSEARQQALEVEKQRAAWISSLDLPTLDQVDQVLLNTDSITATQDTPNNGQQKLPHVEKEKWDTQRDARVAAMEENMNIERNAEMKQEVDKDNAKKAKARFNAALEDEMCDKGFAKIIEHLDSAEKQEWTKNKQEYGKKKPPMVQDSKQKSEKEEQLECIVEKIFNGIEEHHGRNVKKDHVRSNLNEEELLDDDRSLASQKQENFSATRTLKSSNGGLTQLLTRIRQQREDLARQHMDFLDKQHWPRTDHEKTSPFKVSSPYLERMDTDQVSEVEYAKSLNFDATDTRNTEQHFIKTTKEDDKLIVDSTHRIVKSNDLVKGTQPTKFKTKVLHFPPVNVESNKQTTKTEAPGLQDQTVTVKQKVKSSPKQRDSIPVPSVNVETAVNSEKNKPSIISADFPEKITPKFQSVSEEPKKELHKMNYDKISPIRITTTTSSESDLTDEILLTQKTKRKKQKSFQVKQSHLLALKPVICLFQKVMGCQIST